MFFGLGISVGGGFIKFSYMYFSNWGREQFTEFNCLRGRGRLLHTMFPECFILDLKWSIPETEILSFKKFVLM